MAGHVTQLAQRVQVALEARANLKPAVDALFEEIGELTQACVIDIGAGGLFLVCLPGYGPLADPLNHVYVAQRL